MCQVTGFQSCMSKEEDLVCLGLGLDLGLKEVLEGKRQLLDLEAIVVLE
jgi:hypothetical protein